jgi:dienelactone hydrolase
MIDQQIEIATKDGHVTTFISHPERDGPHPVIIFYMVAPGIREELRDMARRLATSGHYVMLPQPDSPHLAGQKTKAELYFGCAETDIYAPMEIIERVKHSMKRDGADAEVEIYPGTDHGFAFPKRPVYNRDAAERQWERLLALYRRRLAPSS